MTETVWVALITGGFTIGASVIATVLAQRHTAKIAALNRIEDRRREVRALLVDLGDAGQRWVATQQIFIPSLYKSALSYISFLDEFVSTDSWKQIGQDNATIRKVGGELLLMVNDQTLLSAVGDLLLLHEGFGTEVVDKLKGLSNIDAVAQSAHFAFRQGWSRRSTSSVPGHARRLGGWPFCPVGRRLATMSR